MCTYWGSQIVYTKDVVFFFGSHVNRVSFSFASELWRRCRHQMLDNTACLGAGNVIGYLYLWTQVSAWTYIRNAVKRYGLAYAVFAVGRITDEFPEAKCSTRNDIGLSNRSDPWRGLSKHSIQTKSEPLQSFHTFLSCCSLSSAASNLRTLHFLNTVPSPCEHLPAEQLEPSLSPFSS